MTPLEIVLVAFNVVFLVIIYFFNLDVKESHEIMDYREKIIELQKALIENQESYIRELENELEQKTCKGE